MTGRSPAPGGGAEPGASRPLDIALAAIAEHASHRPILVITDFDGTLSPIVSEPDDARVVPQARRALERLQAAAARLGPRDVVVAVLSGRDARDVAMRVGVPGLRYLGQHGIESARLGAAPGSRPEVETDPALAAAGADLERLAARVAERLGHPAWLAVEFKGASVGLHYRRAAQPDDAQAAIHAALDAAAAEPGAADADRLESRRVVELRPRGAHGKGEATRRLIEDLGPAFVLVLGDDRTDADGFRTVRALREAGSARALVVGVSAAAETPAEVRDSVDLMVDTPEEAAAVLGALADALAAGPGPTRPDEPGVRTPD